MCNKRVLGHPYPKANPLRGQQPKSGGIPRGEARDGPQGPSWSQQSYAELETPASPQLSAAPMGWAAFSHRERAVWGRMLENGVYAAASLRVLAGESQGAAADAGTRGGAGTWAEEGETPGKIQQHLGWEKLWALHKCRSPLPLLFTARDGTWDTVVPLLFLTQRMHRKDGPPVMEGCELSSPSKGPAKFCSIFYKRSFLFH